MPINGLSSEERSRRESSYPEAVNVEKIKEDLQQGTCVCGNGSRENLRSWAQGIVLGIIIGVVGMCFYFIM